MLVFADVVVEKELSNAGAQEYRWFVFFQGCYFLDDCFVELGFLVVIFGFRVEKGRGQVVGQPPTNASFR